MAAAQLSIAPRIRNAILKILADDGLSADWLVWELGKRKGFSSLEELLEFVGERYGDGVPEDITERLYGALQASRAEGEPAVRMDGSTDLRRVAHPVLLVLPDDMFASAVELGRDTVAAHGMAVGPIQFDRRRRAFEARVSELLLTNGTPYHFKAERLVPSVSPIAVGAAIEPAVDVLSDPRLDDAHHHFVEALRRLQEPDPDEAVDEARQAVESAMLALLDAKGILKPSKHQPQDLFNALVPDAVSRDAEELVLATARFRGRTRAGHAGRPPVKLHEAEAAVASAAGSRYRNARPRSRRSAGAGECFCSRRRSRLA